MSNSYGGTISLNIGFSETVNPGNGLPSYLIPVGAGLQSVTYSTGTGPNQFQKLAEVAGTATGAPVDIDLTAITCVDGTTGFSHVRERILINLDAVNPLKTGDDGVVSNPWVPYYSSGTHPVRTVEPGAHDRVSKPLGTNGYAVGSTSKTVRIDPGANTINYILIVAGD